MTSMTLPTVLGTLPSPVATRHLSRDVLVGLRHPPTAALVKSSTLKDDADSRWRVQPIRSLVGEAMNRFERSRPAADGWLAPRLHATLRLTRAEASDQTLWNYLALVVAPDYVVWRHKGADAATTARFVGAHYAQTFSRVWWAAELFRDGDDYGPVETACRVQDVLNTTMRLDVIDHRPTALAMIRIVERLLAADTPQVGDYVNAMASAVNSAATTIAYDVIAPDSPVYDVGVQQWIAGTGSNAPVLWDILPVGPNDRRVNSRSIATLVTAFEELLAEAPRRNRRSRHAANGAG